MARGAHGAAAQTAPLRILAFGDSLTEGFTDGGFSFHPYANKLQELLRRHQPDVEVSLHLSCMVCMMHGHCMHGHRMGQCFILRI